MKVIIAGCRDYSPTFNEITSAIATSGFLVTEIVTGDALGVDSIADGYAKEMGYDRVIFPPNWKKFGRSAGPIRNEKMANYAEALIAFWDGKSAGTKNMIKMAESYKLKIHIVEIIR